MFCRTRWPAFVLLACGAGLVATMPASSAGTLRVSFAKLATNAVVDLTAEGAMDWVHWGLDTESSIHRKADVPPQIKDFTLVYSTNGDAWAFQYADNLNGFTWQDGFPRQAVTNTPTGVWVYGTPQIRSGFRFTAPATTNEQWLKVYVGAYAAKGLLTVSLSDGSAAPYRSEGAEIVSNLSNGPGAAYTIRYAAQSPGQEVILTYTLADVQGPDRGSGNVTMQGAALTCPGANHPPLAILTTPTNNAAEAEFNDITLAAMAVDVDGSVSLVEFFAGTNQIAESIGPAFSAIWPKAPRGFHVLRARATDDLGVSRWSASVDVFVHGTGGTLEGTGGVPPVHVDLSNVGDSDWAHWGLEAPDDFNHRATGGGQISGLAPLGTNAVERHSNSPVAFVWRDGTPVNSIAGTATGVRITGLTNGFELSAPADADVRTLRVYVSHALAQASFQAWMSDFSAPAFTDTSGRDAFVSGLSVYTLNYRAAGSNERLRVRYSILEAFDHDHGTVGIYAATLQGPAAGVPLLLREPSRTMGTFVFWFLSDLGRNYSAQYQDDAADPGWHALTNLVGTGSTVWITDDASAPQRIYRVTVE